MQNDLPEPAYVGTVGRPYPTVEGIAAQFGAMVDTMAQGDAEFLNSYYEVRPIYEPTWDDSPNARGNDHEFFERAKYRGFGKLPFILANKVDLICQASLDKCNIFVGVNPRVKLKIETVVDGETKIVETLGGKKEFIHRVWFAHADADGMTPEETLTRLAEIGLRPTILIRSSPTGCHVWMRLAKPIDTSVPEGVERAENLNRRLALVFGAKLEGKGGDKCSDISRVLRIPGTHNLPSGKKRRSGRMISMCWLHSTYRVQYGVERLEAVLPALPVRPAAVRLAMPQDVNGIAQNEREAQALRYMKKVWETDGPDDIRTDRGVHNCRDMRLLAHDFALGADRAVEIIRKAGFSVEDDPYWQVYLDSYCDSEPGNRLYAAPTDEEMENTVFVPPTGAGQPDDQSRV